MKIDLRWKAKDGTFLPEVGREDERDMEVEVVTYSKLEEVALASIARIEQGKAQIEFMGADGYFVHAGHLWEADLLPFSVALEMAKLGHSIQREGWNGKGLMVRAQFPDEHSKMTEPYLYIEYPDGRKCPWLASQTDMMATDWRVL